MALTLLEQKKLTTDPLTAAVIEEFAEGDIMRNVPFENILGTGVHYNREEILPGVGFRGLNEAYSESSGVLNPQSEALKIFGGDLDVDKALVDMNGLAARMAHEKMKIKNLRLTWELNFIKGDSSIDPRQFDGLQRRVTGSQLVLNSATAAVLSLSKLDQLVSQVESPTHIIMSRRMRDRMTAAARTTGVTGFVMYSQNPMAGAEATNYIGQQQAYYNGLPILIDSLSNPILPFTETSTDGSSSTACTSIYVVSFGERMLCGIQGAVGGTYGIGVTDLGELNVKPVYRTRVDWYSSIAIYNGWSVARLANIIDGAVVA